MALWLMAASVVSAKEGELQLVRGGEPVAVIVTASHPRQATRLAVAEFQRGLKRITGCELPVVDDATPVDGPRVLIGESAATRILGVTNESFLVEEYLVRATPDTLLIIGRDHDAYGELSYEQDGVYPGFEWFHSVGTLWGVLDFLENTCGMRWYLPGDIGEVFDAADTLAVSPVERRHRAWARHRFVGPRPFPKSLYWYFGLDPVTVKDLADLRTVNLWWLHMRLHNEPLSSSHNYGWFVEKYHQAHPEYFAQGYAADNRHNTQPAFHKPEVVRAVADEAIAHFDLPEEARWKGQLWLRSPEFFAISPNDTAQWCKSPEARAYFEGERPALFWGKYESRYIWDFANQVARRVAEKHPDKWLGCHAYRQYQEPYPGMTIEPNLAVIFARPLSRHWHPVIREQNERALDAWVKLKPGRIYLYDYCLFPQHRNYNQFPGWTPHWIAADLRRMKRIGLRGAYNDTACIRVTGRPYIGKTWVPQAWFNPVLDHVNLVVWFKYLDDPGRDVDDRLDEMFDRLYGPAGPHIQRFVSLAERVYTSWPDYQRPIDDISHIDGRDSWTRLCPPERLAQFGTFIARAKAAAETPEQQARVALFDAGVYQMMRKSAEAWFRENPTLTPDNSLALPDRWKFKPDPTGVGRAQAWFATDLDDASWRDVSTSRHLEDQGIENYTQAWYRVHVDIPAERKGSRVDIRLGAVDESCWIWVNGQRIGELEYDADRDPMSWRKPVRRDITQAVVFGGANRIAVLVRNASGKGGLWKPSHVIYETSLARRDDP